MRGISGEVRTNSKATFSDRFHHPDVQVLADQQELIYDSSVQTQNEVEKTWMDVRDEWWGRERERERESGKPVLAAPDDDDDDDDSIAKFESITSLFYLVYISFFLF